MWRGGRGIKPEVEQEGRRGEETIRFGCEGGGGCRGGGRGVGGSIKPGFEGLGNMRYK